MIITKKAIDFLTADKPQDMREANKRISEYVKKEMLPFCYDSGVEFLPHIDRLPEGNAYIKITSSGNEPKLYAHATDSTDATVFYCRILDNSPAAYGGIATVAGAYLEAIWLYMTINNL